MKRHATANWYGAGKSGEGNLTTQSTVLNETQYSFNSRFADGVGTNPEELLAAAHAGCFTMKLAFSLGEVGYEPEHLETTSYITLENSVINKSDLVVRAKVPGIDKARYEECVRDAEHNCPVSRALSVEITVDASLI